MQNFHKINSLIIISVLTRCFVVFLSSVFENDNMYKHFKYF